MTLRRRPYRISYLLIALMLCAFTPSGRTPRVFLVGDSTMADKPLADNPERGWGQAFPAFFDGAVSIENHARNGRSTKSFINEGRWAKVAGRLQEGDYVFIQFGHNDEKKEDTSRYAEPNTDFKYNLIRFVRESRAKNAIPVLLTPVTRRKFDEAGKPIETHREYSAAVRSVADQEKVPLIDVDAKSISMMQNVGVEESKKLFLWVGAGLYKALPKGKEDNTHFTIAGAKKVASLVVDGIRELNLPLVSYLRPLDASNDVGKKKLVLLDYFFNNEWRPGPDSIPVRFHYVWEDTSFSGFSVLGRTIINLETTVDTLNTAPTSESLAKASMYIIVDPDTPAETRTPNYIDEKSIRTIVEWVRAGGTLLLLGNDKGNAEFEHLNMLAENFGIHFNEDSRNAVKGKEFDMGAFSAFPDHPLFKGVKKIYIKELATLKLSASATSVLTDKGDVIIAYTKFGSGSVFAVGDPWFYNEYFDNRKLPESFENYKAARNLFEWLLKDARPVLNNGN